MAWDWKLLVICGCHLPVRGCSGQTSASGSAAAPRSSPFLSSRSRTDSTITCTMPAAELTSAVPVCVQFENKSYASHNITFKYEKNPVISDINPKKSQIR